MTKRLTGFTVLAATLLVLASVPLFNQPTAVAQSAEGGIGACQTFFCDTFDSGDGCIGFGGLWYGEGSECDDNGNIPCDSLGLCPPISVACCLGDGGCFALVTDLCLELGGTPSPQFTQCSQVTCDQPCTADTDGDGTVGILDFLDVLAQWGDCK